MITRPSLRLAKRKPPHESEMALFHECSPQCAQNELDTADIVRDAMLQQIGKAIFTNSKE